MVKEATELLREAIRVVLTEADTPLTSNQIAAHPEVVALGFTASDVSTELHFIHKRKKKPFPLARMDYKGPGRLRHVYYIPGATTGAAPDEPAAGVNTLTNQPPEFTFDPIDFAGESQGSATAARAVTLQVAGVTIRIELSH